MRTESIRNDLYLMLIIDLLVLFFLFSRNLSRKQS